MKYTYLGRTGLQISRLCLGTMNFGVHTDKKETFRVLDAALDAGINFIDTANNYGFAISKFGITEEFLGEWFAQGGGRRERVVLTTKVHEDMHNPLDGPNSAPGLSLYKIRRHLEESLRRLRTDHVELYFMHHISRRTTWEELWGAFEPLVFQGKVDYIGSSNFAGWHLAQAQAAAAQRHFMGIVCEQTKYNLNCRLPELEVLPSAKSHGIGVVPWGPLDGGLLGRNALKAEPNSRSSNLSGAIERNLSRLQAFGALCRDLGEHEDDVALAWLLANPAISAPVIGPRTVAQLEQSLRAIEITLDPETMKRIDAIFPGPGGEAPEAYAW